MVININDIGYYKLLDQLISLSDHYKQQFKITLNNKYLVKRNCLFMGKYLAYDDLILYMQQNKNEFIKK